MSAESLNAFVEEQINLAAGKIISQKRSEGDEMSCGKLGFYMAVRRVMSKRATPEDLGMLDAINDTLQQLAVLDKGKTFLSGL
ncbi:hypothetical protein [Pseudomonas sp. NA-150]|uniref:hypothetical protein n=1 Tax=Pseudomonas sp. NA-150 TaxID=3367525 RepID=UPI0037C783D5